MKEQYEKHEKFVGRIIVFPPSKGKIRAMKINKRQCVALWHKYAYKKR